VSGTFLRWLQLDFDLSGIWIELGLVHDAASQTTLLFSCRGSQQARQVAGIVFQDGNVHRRGPPLPLNA